MSMRYTEQVQKPEQPLLSDKSVSLQYPPEPKLTNLARRRRSSGQLEATNQTTLRYLLGCTTTEKYPHNQRKIL